MFFFRPSISLKLAKYTIGSYLLDVYLFLELSPSGMFYKKNICPMNDYRICIGGLIDI